VGAVSGAVSPGKLRHRGVGNTAPTPGFPLKADNLTVFGSFVISLTLDQESDALGQMCGQIRRATHANRRNPIEV